MVTFVGTENSFAEAIKELTELDYDATEAYEAAINRLSSETYKKKLGEFMEDHKRHIKELSELLIKHNEKAPQGPSNLKQWIAKGKVVVSDIIGDKAILAAMISNEEDTNTAYERINAREDKWHDAQEIVKRGLEDERRHKEWLEQQ